MVGVSRVEGGGDAVDIVKIAYKVVSIFQVTADGYLTGTITLGRPFAPVESVQGPGSHVIAGARLRIGPIVAQSTDIAIGHAGVGTRPNVSKAEGRVGDVALRARRIILGGVGRGHELGG